MTMREFLDEHRGEISTLIRCQPGCANLSLDDDDLEQWIANDEGLYLWARDGGVDV